MCAFLAPLLVVLLAGCGDSATGPDYALDVHPAEVALVRLADSAVVTASLDGVPVTDLVLVVASQDPEIPGLPVLSAEALGRGVVKPAGPGRATVTVRSDAGDGRFTVQVAPDRPTVFAVRQVGRITVTDTVTLLGSRLDEVPAEGAVTVGELPVDLAFRDAHTLRFPVPEVDPGTCQGEAVRGEVWVSGADLAPGLEVSLARTGDLRMAIGDYRYLTEAETRCIRLPAGGGEYILAWADLRQEVAGRTGWAGFPGAPYTITVRDRTIPAAAGTKGEAVRNGARVASPERVQVLSGAGGYVPALQPAVEETHVRVLDAPASASECSDDDFVALTFWCRSKPWIPGESMRIREPGTPDTVTATVWRVYGGRYVFAVVDGHDSGNLQAFKAAIDASMPRVMRWSVPLFQAVFGTSLPITSPGSGQLLTVIGDFQHSSVGAGCCPEGVGPWAVVTLGSWHPTWGSEIFYLLTHEFAHTWQQRWHYDTRPAGGHPGSSVVWGLEGGADLLALEAVRRYAGVPWRANRSVFSFGDGADPDAPLVRELMASGDIQAGYEHGSSFLRDVVARSVRAGATLDEAYRAAALGSLEDWHGWDFHDVKRPGFTERIQALMGPGWTPGDALLLYTLAQGADDLTPAPDLQNPFFARAGTEPLGDGFGSTVVQGGSGAVFSVGRVATSTGLVRLVDGGRGSSFEPTVDRPEVRWGVARVK